MEKNMETTIWGLGVRLATVGPDFIVSRRMIRGMMVVVVVVVVVVLLLLLLLLLGGKPLRKNPMPTPLGASTPLRTATPTPFGAQTPLKSPNPLLCRWCALV